MPDTLLEISAQISAQNAVISAILVSVAGREGFNTEGRQRKLDEILNDARKIISNVGFEGGSLEQAEQVRAMSIDCINSTFGKLKAV